MSQFGTRLLVSTTGLRRFPVQLALCHLVTLPSTSPLHNILHDHSYYRWIIRAVRQAPPKGDAGAAASAADLGSEEEVEIGSVTPLKTDKSKKGHPERIVPAAVGALSVLSLRGVEAVRARVLELLAGGGVSIGALNFTPLGLFQCCLCIMVSLLIRSNVFEGRSERMAAQLRIDRALSSLLNPYV